MASFRVEGMFDFGELLNAKALPNDVMNRMLHSAADVVAAAQRQTAQSMLQGPYTTGKLVKSIKKGRIKRTKDGKSIRIVFDGGRVRGKRKLTAISNEEIAFLNEYGRRGQPSRPFIQTANNQCGDAAIEAAGREYEKWLESMGF